MPLPVQWTRNSESPARAVTATGRHWAGRLPLEAAAAAVFSGPRIKPNRTRAECRKRALCSDDRPGPVPERPQTRTSESRLRGSRRTSAESP